MIRELWSNKWLAIKEVVEPEQGVHGYTFMHEKRCEGKIVVVLPFKNNPDGSTWYLLRREITPCWGMAPAVSAITGGVEGVDPAITAMQELEEESGFTCRPIDLIPLGTSHGTKSVDTTYYLFAVNVTGRTPGKAKGDGSELETVATVGWARDEDIPQVEDPQVALAYLRLRAFPGKKGLHVTR